MLFHGLECQIVEVCILNFFYSQLLRENRKGYIFKGYINVKSGHQFLTVSILNIKLCTFMNVYLEAVNYFNYPTM